VTVRSSFHSFVLSFVRSFLTNIVNTIILRRITHFFAANRRKQSTGQEYEITVDFGGQ